MKYQILIVFFFISIFSSCEFPEVNLESDTILENCQSDISDVLPLNVVWEQDLNFSNTKFFNPIIYKDFVLIGEENRLSFFNKETGILEKTLEINLPNSSQTDILGNILKGNCFIKGDYLVYQRYFDISISYEYDTLFTETLNLETGNISRVQTSMVGFDSEPFNLNSRIPLLGDGYLNYENEAGEITAKLNNIFDGTETILGQVIDNSGKIDAIPWLNSSGDTLVTSVFSSATNQTHVQTLNFSKKLEELSIDLDISTSFYRNILHFQSETIYYRGKTKLVAIDALSKSTLWEKENLRSIYSDAGSPFLHNLHSTDKHLIDFSKRTLNVFDKNTGDLIFEQRDMPLTIINNRTVIRNDELIVVDENGSLLRIDLNNGCAIWQESIPSNNQDFSGIVTADDGLNRLYVIKEDKLVCIQM